MPLGRVMAGPSDARIRRKLEDVVEGDTRSTKAGRFFLIDQSIVKFLPRDGHAFSRRFLRLLDRLRRGDIPNDPFETFEPLSRAEPAGVLFVDIEATGFTPGTPLFLVGVIQIYEHEVRVRQLLARDYTEESALLFRLAGIFESAQVVISFNGKTYDIPYIRDRMRYYGYGFPKDLLQIDLLHEGRRRYGSRLPNCRLQTLERAICKRGRIGDIPGEEIPDAYHAFVRSGNARDVRDILHHNALDLVTMAEVVLFMLEGRSL